MILRMTGVEPQRLPNDGKTYDTPGKGFTHALHPYTMPHHRVLRDQAKSTVHDLLGSNQSKHDPKFFQREIDFLAEYKKYTSKYPKLKDVFTLLELSLGTQRNNFHRMEDMTIGFLSTVHQSLIATPKKIITEGKNPTGYVYKRWHEVCRSPHNANLLNSGFIPQDFYDEVSEIARQILNEYPDIPGFIPRDPVFFGGAYGHPLAYDVLMKLGETTVPLNFLGYLSEKIIQELIAEKAWGDNIHSNERLKNELGKIEEIRTEIIIRDSLSMCIMLFQADCLANSLEKHTFDTISIDMKTLKSGIEEFVDLRLDLIRENYRAMSDRLSSRVEKKTYEQIDPVTKKKVKRKEVTQIVGRFDDTDYKIFSGHYKLLGLQFLSVHVPPLQTWTNKHRDYSSLMNLFNRKAGLVKKTIMNEEEIQESLKHIPKEAEAQADEIRQKIGALLGIKKL